MSKQPDSTGISLVATEYDTMQVFVIRADGPDADRFATRIFGYPDFRVEIRLGGLALA